MSKAAGCISAETFGGMFNALRCVGSAMTCNAECLDSTSLSDLSKRVWLLLSVTAALSFLPYAPEDAASAAAWPFPKFEHERHYSPLPSALHSTPANSCSTVEPPW